MTLVLMINGTDYGPGGLNLVQSFTPSLSGPGKVGQGTVTLQQLGGGAVLLPRLEVQAYDWNGSQITKVLFGGFIGCEDTDELPSPNYATKTWSLPLMDYNVLLKNLVGYAAWAQAIRFTGAGHPGFADQVLQLCTTLQTGATLPIDAASSVADLVHTGMPDQFFQGKSLYNMLLKLCNDARGLNSALRPAFFIGADTLVPRATFGPPMLYVYDEASPPVSVMSFSVHPTGGQKTILRAPGHPRRLDAGSLVNWRQGVHQATGSVYTASVPGSIALFTNPYDPDGAWKDEPLVTTEVTAGAAFQAKLEAQVAATAYPRETLTLTTDAIPPPLPGQWVDVTIDLFGLSSALYQVAACGIEFPGIGLEITRSTLELGLQKLLLGDDPNTGGTVPPIVLDIVPPDTPSSFTLASNTFNYTTGLTDLVFTWAASTAGDLDPVNSYLLEGFANRVRQGAVTALLTATLHVPAGAAYSATIQSLDTSDNYSARSTALTGTAATGAVPSTVTWPASTGWQVSNVYDPATDRVQIAVTWDANSGSEGVNAYLVYVTRQGVTTQETIDAKDGSHAIVLPEERPGVQLTFGVKARNIVGLSILSALKVWTTASAPPIKAELYNGSFEIPTTDGATLPDGWVVDTGFAILRDGTASAPDGAYALKISYVSGGGVGGAVSRPVAVVGGANYVIAYQTKISTSSGIFSIHEIYVNFYDNSNSLVGQSFQNRTAGTSWGATSFVMTAPSTAVFATVEPLHTIADTYFDDIRFWRQISTPDIAPAAVDNSHLAQGTPVAKADTTANRPGSPVTGQTYFDTNLNIPIWWDSAHWIDATGAAV